MTDYDIMHLHRQVRELNRQLRKLDKRIKKLEEKDAKDLELFDTVLTDDAWKRHVISNEDVAPGEAYLADRKSIEKSAKITNLGEDSI